MAQGTQDVEDRPAWRVEERGLAVELVLDRPERRNPVDYRAAQELVEHLIRLDADPGVGAVLLRGEGSGFCSGGDLREFEATRDLTAAAFHDGGDAWARLMTMIPGLRIPVVCAAHGYALAGGCGLVAAADIAIAAEGTRFGTSEVRIGLFPIIVFPTLARAVGHRRAQELALTGRRIDADEALRIGLVHRVVPASTFEEEARALVDDLASLGPDSLRLGKALMRAVADVPLEPATTLAQAMRGAFMTTDDFAEGVTAFLEKRRPQFRPR